MNHYTYICMYDSSIHDKENIKIAFKANKTLMEIFFEHKNENANVDEI